MSNRKIRLVGGPFGGKVEENPGLYGKNELIYRGPKKMTRKQKWDWVRDHDHIRFMGNGQMIAPGALPQVEARYRMSAYPGSQVSWNGVTPNMPCMHPDGSIFYEYVEGSKREFS